MGDTFTTTSATRAASSRHGRPQAALKIPVCSLGGYSNRPASNRRLQWRNDGVMDKSNPLSVTLTASLWVVVESYPCKEALTERARIAIESSDKAHYSNQGAMLNISCEPCSRGGDSGSRRLERLASRDKAHREAVEAISRRPGQVAALPRRCPKTLAEGEEESIQRLLKRWPAASADFATVDEDPSLVGDAYSAMDFVHFCTAITPTGWKRQAAHLPPTSSRRSRSLCGGEHALGLALPAVGDLKVRRTPPQSIELFTQLHDDKGSAWPWER